MRTRGACRAGGPVFSAQPPPELTLQVPAATAYCAGRPGAPRSVSAWGDAAAPSRAQPWSPSRASRASPRPEPACTTSPRAPPRPLQLPCSPRLGTNPVSLRCPCPHRQRCPAGVQLGPSPGPLGGSRRPCPGPRRPPDTLSPVLLTCFVLLGVYRVRAPNLRVTEHETQRVPQGAEAGARRRGSTLCRSGYADARRTPCCLSPLGARGPRGGAALLNSESTRFLLVWGTTFSLSLYKCVIFFHYKSRMCLL